MRGTTRWLMVTAVLVAAVASPLLAQQADVCTPAPVITSLPFTSTPGDTCTAANDISSYTGTCTLPFPYPGEDVIFAFAVGPGNSVAFSMSLTGSAGDLALFVLSSCGVGSSCTNNSGDLIGPGIGPEVIAATSYSVGTHFLYIDSYYGTADPRGCGTYTLSASGTLPAELMDFSVN